MKKLVHKLVLSIAMFSPMLFSSVNNVEYAKALGDYGSIEKADLKADPKQYIGYGFNVAGGKMLSNSDSLNINSPILDITNQGLYDNVKVFDSSETIYENKTTSSVQEMAKALGGTVGLDSNMEIASTLTNFNTHFDLNVGASWTTTQQEEYSYFVLYAKRNPVVLQLDKESIKNYLNPTFSARLNNIKDKTDARALLETYGTHLLTGYTLGGIFEMTNYYATRSSSYERQLTSSFSSQVDAGFSANKLGQDFSFSAQYGAKDNNSFAVNNYKCTTFGGHVFPGLTMDQAFTWYEVPLYGAGYVYDIWTKSINAAENLVIVDIPQSSKMLPLWDLLPNDASASEKRNLIIDAYVEMCGGALETYNAEHRDVFPTDLNNKGAVPAAEYVEKGFNYEYKLGNGNSLYSYVDTAQNKGMQAVNPGSVITMDYDRNKLYNHEITWELEEGCPSTWAKVLDPKYGIIEIPETASKGQFKLTCLADKVPVFTQAFNIVDAFSGGNGSESDPYLISKISDLQFLSTQQAYWKQGMHFKLTNDLVFPTNASERINLDPIGNRTSPFKGCFDGDYYTIYNLTLNSDVNLENWGLFGFNNGTIKNLNIDSTINNDNTCDFSTLEINVKNTNLANYNYLSGGIVCGTNGSTGVIENIHINHSKVYISMPSFNIWKDARNCSFGGITGYNSGNVNNCSIANSKITHIVPEIRSSITGGIIGINDTAINVDKCSADAINVYSECGVYCDKMHPHNKYAMAGGIIGQSIKGNVRNCIVSNIDGDINSENNPRIVSVISGKAAYDWSSGVAVAPTRHRSYAGGLAGQVGVNDDKAFNTTFTNCIVYNTVSVNNKGVAALENIQSSKGGSSRRYSGIYTGYAYYSVKNYDNYFSDCCVKHDGQSAILGVDSSAAPSTIIKNECLWNTLPQIFKNTDIWGKNENNYPVLIHKAIDLNPNAFTVNTDNAKKIFFVGESFTPGNIKLHGTYNDGSAPFEIDNFVLDSSAFKSNTPGIYPIKVFACGVELPSYNVSVVEPGVTSIVVAKEPTKKEYYEAEKFDPTGMELTVFKENGTKVNVPVTESMIISNEPLKKGTNNLEIKYEDQIMPYKVVGKVRNVTGIEIVSLPTKTNYIVGINSINLDGLQVKATYENGATQIVPNDQLEVINSNINYGDNTIVVCFGYYKRASFVVKGTVDYSLPEIQAFFNAVEEAENATTLLDKKTSINEALKLKDALGDMKDEKIVSYTDRLNACVENFEAIVGAVNNDFKENIEITCNVNYSAIVSSSVYAASLLLAILLKLF